MSFRNTFVTDFIYGGSNEEVAARTVALVDVFNAHCSVVDAHINERGLGYVAGFIKTSNLGVPLSEMELESLVWDLDLATPVPFRITVLQESGAAITYNIEPRQKS